VATHVGSGGLRVYATPAMVRFVEQSCFRMLEPLLAEGQTTVGVEIMLRHLAPTPLGQQVHLRAEIIAVAEGRVRFQFETWDSLEVVGRGEHERAIIDIDRFQARVRAKASTDD
jgi:predicted thioesterase